ncbi:type IV secretory system conjugative DNA transfer family protein [Ulvibacterium sp.]|uniref:type IV secretory system conjugative DNA transfer family protein n=1 Tax=Ulvibacterium sp. TaxID=2665914 RepID=UPI003BAADC37
MEQLDYTVVFWILLLGSGLGLFIVRRFKSGFYLNTLWIILGLTWAWSESESVQQFIPVMLVIGLPLFFINILWFVYFPKESDHTIENRYVVRLKVSKGKVLLQNIRRGIAIIGAAGSGKTESVVYPLLRHFNHWNFSGVIYDYKNFEITEMAYPLFSKGDIPFQIISFDTIYAKVNPIAPRYLPDEESVNEVSRVLVENLLEQKDNHMNATTRFFNDVVEGLIGGMIWRLKTDFEDACTLPHLIALYQHLDTKNLIRFLSGNTISRAMADAFISGVESERQTAGVKSTLANAFKKISTQRIFMVLSEDEINLNINDPNSLKVISVVNNPRIETSLSPVIATILHTITKQMSVRHRNPSFLLMEEAATLRLLNMHRIPATLRSYNIATVYVLQDKIQNDMMYGPMASKAILSNLSYQFFGKANDPDTAKYYERFFEIVKQETKSVNKGYNLNFDTRVTKGEREVAKTRANVFYGLRQGGFVVLADGKDEKVQFRGPKILRQLPLPERNHKKKLQENFERIHIEVQGIFGR